MPKTSFDKVELTAREFEIIFFRDRYDTPCSLQQSSLADFQQPGTSAVWLGIDRQEGQHDGLFDSSNQTRMHLDFEGVKALRDVLDKWIESGSFTGRSIL